MSGKLNPCMDANLKHFGQHFLVDDKTIDEFIRACRLKKNDRILEIGPGKGALTKKIFPKVKELVCVEIDPAFRQTLSPYKVFYQNILDWQDFNYDLVCGALSYAIFEPLMIRLFKNPDFKRGVFLVSAKLKKEQGFLGYLLKAFFDIEFSPIITKDKFSPAPRAPGIIISLKRKKLSDFSTLFWQELFLQSDKKLKNSLREALIKAGSLSKKQANAKLSELIEMPEANKTIWQVANNFLDKTNEIIVYLRHAQH